MDDEFEVDIKLEDCPRLSTGKPPTLGNYLEVAEEYGPAAIEIIEQKIKESKKGTDEIVIAAESQMRYLFGHKMMEMLLKEVGGHIGDPETLADVQRDD